MKAYKCDRCGVLFQPSLNSPEFRLKKYTGDWEYDEVDLCAACVIDLKRFMREVDNGKEKEN